MRKLVLHMGECAAVLNDDEARNVLELFSNLNLNLRENDTLRASVDENVTNATSNSGSMLMRT